MVQWSPYVLDSSIAPGFSTFTAANIPNVADAFPEERFWLTNHFLNTALGPQYKPPYKQHVVTLLMRCQAAFRYYGQARGATIHYLSADVAKPAVRSYFEALNLWEVALLNWGMAVESFNPLSPEAKAFKSGDGSLEERAYLIHNAIKHWSKSGSDSVRQADDTVPMWLVNDGLMTRVGALSFAEVATLLGDLGAVANRLQHPAGVSGAVEGRLGMSLQQTEVEPPAVASPSSDPQKS